MIFGLECFLYLVIIIIYFRCYVMELQVLAIFKLCTKLKSLILKKEKIIVIEIIEIFKKINK